MYFVIALMKLPNCEIYEIQDPDMLYQIDHGACYSTLNTLEI